jgi:SAM-dependent methyltransferase
MKRHAKTEFYDGYHSKSAATPLEAEVRRKTRRIFEGWVDRLAPPPGGKLLELSCGLGQFLEVLRDRRPDLKLHGLDFSPFAVAQARRLVPQAKVVAGDAMKLPYPAASFDMVTCLGALEHYPDSGQGLKEIARVLKPGGRAFVYVPNQFFLGYIYLVWRSGETPHEAGQNQYERFETRQGWEGLIDAAGLTVDSVSKHNDMYATERLPGWVRAAYQAFIRPCVPLNLSYCFGFSVSKPHAAPSAKRAGR